MHDPVIGLSHIFLPKRKGLLVFPVVRSLWYRSQPPIDLHVGRLLRFLVSQGPATILSDHSPSDLLIRDDTADTEFECKREHQTDRFRRLGSLWSAANTALEYSDGWHGQSDR